MPTFRDIPQFTRGAHYAVDVEWGYLSTFFTRHIVEDRLDINPEFQRGFCWSSQQKKNYIQYILRGGMSGRDIYCNCPFWQFGSVQPKDPQWQYVLVDGKQRLDAVLGFLNNEFTIFDDHYFKDFTDKLRMSSGGFKWHINTLKTYNEVLDWYIQLNTGGTVHDQSEIDRVKDLIKSNPIYTPPSFDEAINQSKIERSTLKEAYDEIIATKEKEKAEKIRVAEIEANRVIEGPIRITWRNEKRPSGLAGIGAGEMGYEVFINGIKAGGVYAARKGLAFEWDGWYWLCSGRGIDHRIKNKNTVNIKKINDKEVAKLDCENYIRKCLGLKEK